MPVGVYEQVRAATHDFTRVIELRSNGRITRYIEPGRWQWQPGLVMRSAKTMRIVAGARLDDHAAIEAMLDGYELVDD